VQPIPSSPKWTGHSAATTLLLDDSHVKAALQPYNHLCVPEYTRTQRNADLTVLQLERAVQQQQQQQQRQLQEEQEQEQHSSISHQEYHPATADTTTDTHAHEHTVSSADGTTEKDVHKRKRKKKTKKKSQARELQQQLAAIAAAADGASPTVPDETLLAVIGILHAARLQSSIAGWLRADALLLPPFSERARVAGMGDGDAKTWCNDPVLVRAWASRGREAMHELGLKVEHGVES